MATSKILLTGGNTKFPNFQSRYEQDLRPFVPEIYRINVSQHLVSGNGKNFYFCNNVDLPTRISRPRCLVRNERIRSEYPTR